MKKEHLLPAQGGLRLLQLPNTGAERANTHRRNLRNLGTTTAAASLAAAEVCPEGATLFCGRHSAALPFLAQLTRMTNCPFVVLGSEQDFGENDCFRMLPHDWEDETVREQLPDGSGLMTLCTDGDTVHEFKIALHSWEHLVILCLGRGLQLDSGLLDALNRRGGFVLVTEALNRSVKCVDEGKLNVQRVLSSMDYLLISSIGSEAKDLLAVLPTYEEERVSNTLDWQTYRNAFGFRSGSRRGNGGGFRVSQTRSLETKPILRQEDLREMEAQRRVLLYNARASAAWSARIVR